MVLNGVAIPQLINDSCWLLSGGADKSQTNTITKTLKLPTTGLAGAHDFLWREPRDSLLFQCWKIIKMQASVYVSGHTFNTK